MGCCAGWEYAGEGELGQAAFCQINRVVCALFLVAQFVHPGASKRDDVINVASVGLQTQQQVPQSVAYQAFYKFELVVGADVDGIYTERF